MCSNPLCERRLAVLAALCVQVPSSRVHQAQGGTPSELKRLADLEAKFAHLTAKPTQQHTATYQQSLDRALHEVGRNHPEVQDAFKQGYKQAGYVPWRPGWKKAFDTCFTMFVYMLLPLVALCSIGVLFLTVMFFVWLFSRMG